MADFSEINKHLNEIGSFVNKRAKEIVAIEAINHFTENFEKQSFEGKKWKDVKRRNPTSAWYGFSHGAKSKKPARHPSRKGVKRKYKARKENPTTNYSPVARKTPILSSRRSQLEKSLQYKINDNRITVYSNLPYAEIHNKGGQIKVFGKTSVKMPARQYMGNTRKLRERINKALTREFKRINR